jgi:WD40 repeat protein
MANGKVLVIGQEQGIDSSNILEGGQYLYEWDSNNPSAFVQLEPSGQNLGIVEVDSLARSADHKWAVFSADRFYLYSSDTDSLTGIPLSTVNPPQNEFGVRGYALNADGSKIAVASATEVSFFDRSFTFLGSTQLQTAFQTARSAVQFTPDGTRLFLQYALPLWLEEVDATNYASLGVLSGSVDPDNDNLERLLTLDAEGRGYVGIDEGLRLVNLTQPPVPNSANNNNPGPPSCPGLQAVLPLGTSQQVSFMQPINGLSLYIGGVSAPMLQGGTAINIPASSTPGAVDVECVDSYGDMSVAIAAVSYGVDPVALSANLLPPTGNPTAYLFGFGFYGLPELDYTTNPPFQGSVSVGGQPGTGAVTLGSQGLSSTLGALAFHIPNGSAGNPADVAVSSSFGSGTLASAATYYPAPTIVAATGLLQLVYDGHRNLLYALKASEVDVLNPITLQWQPPLVFPSAATGSYNTMALTPDGSKLVVAGLAGSAPQFIVLDPGNSSAPSVLTYTGYSSVSGSIAITEFNTVVMPGDPGLVLDLSTSSFTSLPFFGGDVIRASADGSHLFASRLNSSGGQVFSVDPSTYAVQSKGFGRLFWTDLAVSPDGSQFAAVDAPPDAAGDIVGFFDSTLHYLNANVYPDFSPPDDTGVLGATFSPGGKVLVVALGDSVEFWDSARGTLRARLMTPERLHVLVYPEGAVAPMLALDQIGQTIYAVSASGLTVLKLPGPLDQMPPMQWPLTSRFNSQAWLYGSITSRMAAMPSKPRN